MGKETLAAGEKHAIESKLNKLIHDTVLSTQGVYGLKRPVKAELVGDAVKVDVFPVVYYGVKIPSVAWDIQENVKKQVEEKAGYTVSAVNIYVQGVHIVRHETYF